MSKKPGRRGPVVGVWPRAGGPPIPIEPTSSVDEEPNIIPRKQPIRTARKQPRLAPSVDEEPNIIPRKQPIRTARKQPRLAPARKRKATSPLGKSPSLPASPSHSSDSDATISAGPSSPIFTAVKRLRLGTSDISEAAIDANAPLLDETDALGPVDSDEEMNQVMMGIARSRPQPIAQHIPVSTRKRYANIRLKEMLRQGLSGTRAVNYGVEGAGVYGTPTPAGGGGLTMSGALGGLAGGGIGVAGGGAAVGGATGNGLEAGETRRASGAQPSGGSGGRTSIGGGGTTPSATVTGMPARKASTASQGPAAAS
ncbi:hypothetical protein MMC18_002989 [Xylographa bjoerkii]|nr:hypothetical protein [Xylographa bjoerkii]